MKDTEAIEGSKLELPVRLTDCYPVPTTEWSKDNQSFTTDSNHQIESLNSEHKLIVLSATESDEGKYTFKTINELGTAETTCQASVLVKPTFIKQLESKNTSFNTVLQWGFELRSKPLSVFKIFKDNKELKTSDKITVEKLDSSETSYSLTFKNVEASDVGTYKLVATNKCGTATSDEASLSVTGAACIVKKPNPQVYVAEKKGVKIDFEVAGIPLPEVQWFKNGQPLAAEPRLKIENKKSIHILSLDMATVSDAAEFTLTAKNDSGEASESFSLIIQSIFFSLF